ncbi:MAG: ferredoxin [Candidatus Sericytochromatia bacterium]|nr:ferredoxin [Candidatus Sericytochromatia bacterium]
MEAQVNKETCIGCGRCVTTSPEVFRMFKRKSAIRTDADYSMTNYVEMAAKNCPSKSISVNVVTPAADPD